MSLREILILSVYVSRFSPASLQKQHANCILRQSLYWNYKPTDVPQDVKVCCHYESQDEEHARQYYHVHLQSEEIP